MTSPGNFTLPAEPFHADMIHPTSFLVAIPAYREHERLPTFLPRLAASLDERFPSARIVVCDDGSGREEQTRLRKAIEPLLPQFRSLLPPLFLETNRGKGGAILAGWDRHPGFDYVGFVDADGAVSAGELCRVAERLAPAGDGPALFASRIKMLGREIDRDQARHLIGRIFAVLVGALIEPAVYDSQCGLKFIPSSAFLKIRPWLKGHRFAFDVELLAALSTIKCPIREVPIDWHDVAGSKVSLFKDTFRMFRSLLIIRKEMERWKKQGNGAAGAAGDRLTNDNTC